MTQIFTTNTLLKSEQKMFNAMRKSEKTFPKIISILFLILAVYLVIPIIDVPLLGLSLSAPIFFIIAATCVFRPPFPWFFAYRKWILFGLFIWLGIFFSTVLNGLISGGMDIDNSSMISIVQYLYWLLVFVFTSYFASRQDHLEKVSFILGVSIFILALLRWYEVWRYGNIGAWTGTYIFTQNTYGLYFSVFSPFLLYIILHYRLKLLSIFAYLILIGAAVINGSRGSWVAMAVGLIICLVFLVLVNPRKYAGAILIISIIAVACFLIWNNAPVKFTQTTETRFSTLLSLEEDKSYTIRQVMIQKGIKMFQKSPIIGVGANRFTKSWIKLDIPDLLSSVSTENLETRNSHNSYIQFLAEFGLLGSIPFGLLLLNLAFGGFSIAQKKMRTNDLIPLTLFLSFFQMSMHLWVIAALTGTICWFIYGLMAAAIMREKNLRKTKCV